MSHTEILVTSEFAPLRTVVLARCELSVPEPAPGSPELRFLPEGAAERNSLGRDLREADPERQAAWEREREAFGALLESHGVKVLRPRPLSEEEKRTGDDGYANFFSRDPFFTVGGHVIEGSLRLRHRRREILPIRDILDERVYPADCAYVAVPRPAVRTAGGEEPGPFLEGGDVLVLGDRVFVGERLAGRGVRVEYVDFSITRSFGGSFRCSTQALSRF